MTPSMEHVTLFVSESQLSRQPGLASCQRVSKDIRSLDQGFLARHIGCCQELQAGKRPVVMLLYQRKVLLTAGGVGDKEAVLQNGCEPWDKNSCHPILRPMPSPVAQQ